MNECVLNKINFIKTLINIRKKLEINASTKIKDLNEIRYIIEDDEQKIKKNKVNFLKYFI